MRVWTDELRIREAVARLLEAAPLGSRVILFGSRARGDADSRSDVDLMVVEPTVYNRLEEMVRLGRVIQPLKLPVDLLVVSAERFEYWRETPNTVYHEAVKEGVVYDALA
ncbi:MAG: nucleotidyltransferase domain-containing protein [Candidatus Sumerlaeota bacterium]|nr:nucleotidyltransferase domain-containing protein [Candidatus Sumerlaeota bacterium]